MSPSDRRPGSILAVSPVAEAGGAEVLLVELLAGLRRYGFRVGLFTFGEGPLPELARGRGLDVNEGPTLSLHNPVSVFVAARALGRAVTDLRPDVVHASHPKGQVIARLACVGLDVVHTTQLYDPPSVQSLLDRFATRLTGIRFAISSVTAEAYQPLLHENRLVVIPPGVDLAEQMQRSSRGDGQAAWTNAGFLDKSRPRIVMVCRLQRFKGPFKLLDMVERVGATLDAYYLIIGPDSPREPTLRQELDTCIRDRKLGGSVGLAGRLHADDLAATVAGSTLFVHPAQRETFGLVLVESLALGTPVVAFDGPGPRQIIGGGGGALVPEGNVAALADTVLSALGDPALLRGWESETKRIAEAFDLQPMVLAYRHMFLELSHAADGGGAG